MFLLIVISSFFTNTFNFYNWKICSSDSNYSSVTVLLSSWAPYALMPMIFCSSSKNSRN